MSTGELQSTIIPKRLAFFERYLTLWVFLCMVAGVLLGKLAPAFTASLSQLEFGHDSHVNVAIAVLKKAQDIQSTSALQLLDAVQATAPAQNLPPHLGNHINTTA